MDPLVGGGDGAQSGGFVDPGLAALIAAILSGGVGFYGYSKSNDDKDARAAAALGVNVKALEAKASKATENAMLAEGQARRIRFLESEVEKLKGVAAQAQRNATAVTGPALTFKNATPDVLDKAIDGVIEGLRNSQYAYLVSKPDYEGRIRDVLKYPTSYQARLSRLTLPDFYDKRVQVVFQQIADMANKTGGRRRRYRKARRGGRRASENQVNEYVEAYNAVQADKVNPTGNPSLRARLANARKVLAATDDGPAEIERLEPEYSAPLPRGPAAVAANEPVEETFQVPNDPETLLTAFNQPATSASPQGIPSYDEFAKLYADAILAKTVSARTAEDARQSQAKAQKQKKLQATLDTTAKKNAADMAKKLLNSVDDAAKKITPIKYLHKTLSRERQRALEGPAKRVVEYANAVNTLFPVETLDVIDKNARTKYEKTLVLLRQFAETLAKIALIGLAYTGPMSGGEQEGGAWNPFKKIAADPGAPPTFEAGQTWNTVLTAESPAKTLGEMKPKFDALAKGFTDAVDAYIAAVRQAADDEKKGLAIAKPSFGLPTLSLKSISISNPLAEIIRNAKQVLETTGSELEAAKVARAESGEAIRLIKEVVQNAQAAVKELTRLQSLAPRGDEIADGNEGLARAPEGVVAQLGGEDDPEMISTQSSFASDPGLDSECKKVRELIPLNMPLPWFKDQLVAMLEGKASDGTVPEDGVASADGTRWVNRALTSAEITEMFPEAAEAKPKTSEEQLESLTEGAVQPPRQTVLDVDDPVTLPSFKYLLSKLNTSMFSGVKDVAKAAFGSSPTFSFVEAALAGEAYVVLRCYMDAIREPLSEETAKYPRTSEAAITLDRVKKAASKAVTDAARTVRDKGSDAIGKTRRAITDIRDFFKGLLNRFLNMLSSVVRRARATAATDARKDAEAAAGEAATAAGEVAAEAPRVEEAIPELEARAAAPTTSPEARLSITKLISALRALLTASKKLNETPPPPPPASAAEEVPPPAAEQQAPPPAAEEVPPPAAEQQAPPPAAEEVPPPPPTATPDAYTLLGLKPPPPRLTPDDIDKAYRSKQKEIRLANKGKTPDEIQELLKEINAARDKAKGDDETPFQYEEETAAAATEAAAEVQATDPSPEMKSIFEKLAPLFAAANKAATAASKARSFLRQFATSIGASPKKVREGIATKFRETLKAYERRKERANKIAAYKQVVADELKRIADEEATLTQLEGFFRGTRWNVEAYPETILASVNLEAIPSWNPAGFFPEDSDYNSKSDDQKRKIYEAGARIFKARKILADIKPTETFKAFQQSPSLFKSSLTPAIESEFVVRQEAYGFRFGDDLRAVTEDVRGTVLKLLVEAGVEDAVEFQTKTAPKPATTEAAPAATTEEVPPPAAEGVVPPPVAEVPPPATPKVDEKAAKKAAEKAKKAEAKAAADAKKAADKAAAEAKKAEAKAAEEAKKLEAQKKAALSELDALTKSLDDGTAKPAALKAALAKNMFLAPVAEVASAAIETDVLTPVQNEVDIATTQYENAIARRTEANTKEERVFLDSQVERARKLRDDAAAKLETVKETVPEATFRKALALAAKEITAAQPAAVATAAEPAFGTNPMLQPRTGPIGRTPKAPIQRGLSTFFKKQASPFETPGREAPEEPPKPAPFEIEQGTGTPADRLRNPLRAPNQVSVSEGQRRWQPPFVRNILDRGKTRRAQRLEQQRNAGLPSTLIGTADDNPFNKGAYPEKGGKRRTTRRKARKSTLKKRRGGK